MNKPTKKSTRTLYSIKLFVSTGDALISISMVCSLSVLFVYTSCLLSLLIITVQHEIFFLLFNNNNLVLWLKLWCVYTLQCTRTVWEICICLQNANNKWSQCTHYFADTYTHIFVYIIAKWPVLRPGKYFLKSGTSRSL